ncbi:Retrovirus-related Pol polyprotein from transposon [Ceratobasidium sp. AG-Ba]|nr:Retrovirus-related Pol polyprotein from transposon [Ceratobasidium sp. AG-Ba]
MHNFDKADATLTVSKKQSMSQDLSFVANDLDYHSVHTSLTSRFKALQSTSKESHIYKSLLEKCLKPKGLISTFLSKTAFADAAARSRQLATYSDPPRPSVTLVDRLANTLVAPVPTVTISTPQSTPNPVAPSLMASKDLRAAQANLNSLPRFNDNTDPIREVEWCHNFIVATRGVTDEERAQLWADWLVFQGVAYDWYEALQKSHLDDAKDWSKLVLKIESRWPTPVCDAMAMAEQKRIRWDHSVLWIEGMLPGLLDKSNPVRPHETWAKQHLSRGKDRGSSNEDLVHNTLKRAIPLWMVEPLQ